MATFLKVLCLKWAWNLKLDFYDWIHEPLHKGYCKMMFKSNDIKNVSFVWKQKIEWTTFFHLFPNIVSLTMPPSVFSDMMEVSPSPKELIHLKDFTFYLRVESMSDAISALSKYQSKCTFLETIGYTHIQASEIQYESDLTLPAVKHLKVNLKQECCVPLDFTFLSATAKLFPGLKDVHITVYTCCDCEIWSRSLTTLEKTYEAFDALKYDFFIKVTYYEELFFGPRSSRADTYTFLSTKGDVYDDSRSLTVNRVLPDKLLIHEVAAHEEEEHYDVYDFESDYEY